MNDLSLLFVLARSYIDRGWTQHAWARDDSGKVCTPSTAPEATCWCLAGAILAACRSADLRAEIIHDTQVFFRNQFCIGDIVHWNDNYLRTKSEVLRVLDTAIEITQEKNI